MRLCLHFAVGFGAKDYQFKKSKINMTALDFETKALDAGLKIGWKLDFQWIIDERKCCCLVSKAALEFARSSGVEIDQNVIGQYFAYFDE